MLLANFPISAMQLVVRILFFLKIAILEIFSLQNMSSSNRLDLDWAGKQSIVNDGAMGTITAILACKDIVALNSIHLSGRGK